MSGKTTCACAQNCGAPVHGHGFGSGCYKRWTKAGRPESGPPPPPTREQRMATARAARRCEQPDLYEVQWYAGEGERRVMRARPRAAALAQCVAARDGRGVEVLLSRLEDGTAWAALAVVLAECADPVKVAAVCGTQGPVAGKAAA